MTSTSASSSCATTRTRSPMRLLTGFPTGDLRDALADVTGADALVAVTPTFQRSYSGLFKSFLDLLEAGTLRGVPVLLAATGGTERHSLVIEHALRPLFSYLGALTVPTGVYAATADFGGEGSAPLAARVDRAAAELAALLSKPGRAGRRPSPRSPRSRTSSRHRRAASRSAAEGTSRGREAGRGRVLRDRGRHGHPRAVRGPGPSSRPSATATSGSTTSPGRSPG